MQPKYYGAAARYNKSGSTTPLTRRLLVIGGLVVGVIIFAIVVFSVLGAISKGPQDAFTHFAARESNLATLMDQQSPHIQSGDLSAINVTGKLLFNGDNSAAQRLLTSAFGLQAIPADVTASETDSTVTTSLQNASLNGTFDHTYVSILQQEIASTYNGAQALASSGGAIGALAKKAMANLTTINDQLTALKL